MQKKCNDVNNFCVTFDYKKNLDLLHSNGPPSFIYKIRNDKVFD